MKRVLIVEDNEVNMELMLSYLEDHYEVLEATNGRIGIEMAREHKPDIILMDLSLPEIDGWEATRQLKADENTKKIPIIAVTAHAVKGEYERAMEAGCDAYLTKPIDEDLILGEIEAFLKNA